MGFPKWICVRMRNSPEPRGFAPPIHSERYALLEESPSNTFLRNAVSAFPDIWHLARTFSVRWGANRPRQKRRGCWGVIGPECSTTLLAKQRRHVASQPKCRLTACREAHGCGLGEHLESVSRSSARHPRPRTSKRANAGSRKAVQHQGTIGIITFTVSGKFPTDEIRLRFTRSAPTEALLPTTSHNISGSSSL